MRRTTSLLVGKSNANAICCAMRGQPHVGLRCFMSTTAATTSRLGPRGPGFCRTVGENSRRYFRVFSARCRRKNVAGFKTIAERISRLGRMEERTHASHDAISEAEIRRSFPRPIENEQLLLEEHRFGDHRPGAGGTGQS